MNLPHHPKSYNNMNEELIIAHRDCIFTVIVDTFYTGCRATYEEPADYPEVEYRVMSVACDGDAGLLAEDITLGMSELEEKVVDSLYEGME